ncbi:MAG: thiamine-phosphate kinase [Nitrospiria bacterium]
MKLHEIGEFGWIEHIQRRFKSSNINIPLGIGDDAAAIRATPQSDSLLTTDTLIEETHFSLAYSSFEQVGLKAVAVNVSDIAAMGGHSRALLISLGVPGKLDMDDLNRLYRGIAKGCKKTGIEVIGGNTARTSGPFFITITLFGEVLKKEMLTRSGAKTGDLIYVTGTLGDAAAGLDILKNRMNRRSFTTLVRRHQTPEARCEAGCLLGAEKIPSAMIDLSDGLTADLRHIMRASRVGAELVSAEIPLSPALKRYARQLQKDARDFALYGGEDYELLFSVPQKKEKKLVRLIKNGLIQARRIGRILPEKEGFVLKTADGETRTIAPKGYDHFLPQTTF